MDKRELIKKLYFNEKYKQIEIASILNVSNKYVSKVLIKDDRYLEEKEKRKLCSKQKNRNWTKEHIKNKREMAKNDEVYQQLKLMHIQASQEMSEGKKISNRAFRDWNSSIYEYNEKLKLYSLKKGIRVGADVPKKIKWRNQ